VADLTKYEKKEQNNHISAGYVIWQAASASTPKSREPDVGHKILTAKIPENYVTCSFERLTISLFTCCYYKGVQNIFHRKEEDLIIV
jgi:hypothetical protein